VATTLTFSSGAICRALFFNISFAWENWAAIYVRFTAYWNEADCHCAALAKVESVGTNLLEKEW